MLLEVLLVGADVAFTTDGLEELDGLVLVIKPVASELSKTDADESACMDTVASFRIQLILDGQR